LKSNKNISSSEFYTNGLLALEKLKELNIRDKKYPTFIILDFNMPVMNGLEFLENIKHLESINQIPVFMNSASSELDEYRNCLNYENVKGSFSKPFSKQALNAILEYIESK
jgi:CheY-like chemotaxis protein